MKNCLFFLAAAFLSASCSQNLEVEVSNPTATARDHETVEIAWSQLSQLKGVTPEQVVVLNSEGEQVPSQVIYCGGIEPQALIFQVNVDGMETEHFTIEKGVREAYPAQAFGRQVPERYDDYAWENNKVAYRLYGPALETAPGEMLITPGIDVWVKCTDKLVIDEWYAKGNYHHNYGDGMDCYKVGRTLGGGSSVPFIDGQLFLLPHNYQTCKTLDNGPIRTSVELVYAPFAIGDKTVALTKIITLDANQRFNRMDCIYTGEFTEMPVAAGFVRHDVKQTLTGEDWVAICEPASDSKDPVRDGDIYGAAIWSGAEILPDAAGHALAVKSVRPSEKSTYYAGTGWSQGGITDMDAWVEQVNGVKAAIETPLQVVVK